MSEPDAPEVPDGEELDHFDQCLVTGFAHPAGLAATVRRDGDALELLTRVPIVYEGMPGHAHGGILAAVFEDLVGLMMGRLHRIPAPTVRIDVSFRRPVPLDTEVRFRAEPSGGEGRKRTGRGLGVAGGTACTRRRPAC